MFYGSYKLELFVELMIGSDACVRVRARTYFSGYTCTKLYAPRCRNYVYNMHDMVLAI
jgi:hypothetical protein